jgi:hypothetical protein
MPNAVECKGNVCLECDQQLPKRPIQNRPGLLGIENIWVFEGLIRSMQILQRSKVLQEIVPDGFAATNLSPQPGRGCACTVGGGLLVDG